MNPTWLKIQKALTPTPNPEYAGIQRRFDILFGILMPVACFIAEPFVLKTIPMESITNDSIRFLAGFEIAALATWLFLKGRLSFFAVWFRVFFAFGALLSITIGIIFSLFSVIGIFFYGIGLLGFTPWLTFIVFLRNYRSIQKAPHHTQFWEFIIPITCAAALILSAWFLNQFVFIPLRHPYVIIEDVSKPITLVMANNLPHTTGFDAGYYLYIRGKIDGTADLFIYGKSDNSNLKIELKPGWIRINNGGDMPGSEINAVYQPRGVQKGRIRLYYRFYEMAD